MLDFFVHCVPLKERKNSPGKKLARPISPRGTFISPFKKKMEEG
jgi:hypothetical protein